MKKELKICVNNLKTAFAVLLTLISVAATASPASPDQTTLYVVVTVERQEIITGPYARYAQKYLAVTAPLADKVLHQVKSVKILNTSDLPREILNMKNVSTSHMNPLKGFPRLTIDKTSAVTMSLEESARLAAEKIFEIRKSRLDLITGEVGENVFGGGLEAALKELGRLEEEYLSLFLGKQTISIEARHYPMTPNRDRLSYTVCRFSEVDGLLPHDATNGSPMDLELKFVDEGAMQSAVNQAKPNSRAVARLIPADVRCRIILDGVELTFEQFPILQLGTTTWITP